MKLLINPPNGKCDCCNKPVSELKPFGKAGDPLVGDFDGALLVKTFRSIAPVDEELSKKMEKVEKDFRLKGNYDGFEEAIIREYGEAEAERLMFYDQLINTVSASWECRDCILLGMEEYFKVKFKNNQEEK